MTGDKRPLLIVVEGKHDIDFLVRMSVMLHRTDAALPDLRRHEEQGDVVFIPTGGTLSLWTDRLAGLHHREFHLYDRELPPESFARQEIVAAINRRPGCRATLTRKRSVENYLSPASILEAGGPQLHFGDDDDVAELLARSVHAMTSAISWDELPPRNRARKRNRTKRWLNTAAVDRMTPARLAEVDPDSKVIDWLRAIAVLST